MRSPLVVLVHGTRDRANSFDAVRDLLGDLDVVTYTRRGWERGASGPPTPLLETHVDDLFEVIAERTAVVVGHSWGSHVAFAAALQRPDLIRSIGVWEPSDAGSPSWPTLLHDHLVAAIERARHRLDPTPDRHRNRTFVAEASASLERQYDLNDLRVPCVLGIGGASPAIFAKALEEMATSIGAEVFEVPGAHHMAHREHPKDFADFVRRAVAIGGG